MAARVYFVTGKGGAGKSTLAQAFTQHLTREKKKRTLLLRMNSFSLSQSGYEPIKKIDDLLYKQDMHLHKVVEEYFTVTLAKIPLPSFFQKMAAKINEEVATRLLANRYILKFIEACPGLTPTIFLGKVCYEARHGRPPDSAAGTEWDAIVVDAPSTGQALQVFDSSRTLSKVLSQGMIHRHIIETLACAHGDCFEVHLLTLPEDGPVQECLETVARFKDLEISPKRIWINKVSSLQESERLQQYAGRPDLAADVRKYTLVEIDRIDEQRERIHFLESKLAGIPTSEIVEGADSAHIQIKAGEL